MLITSVLEMPMPCEADPSSSSSSSSSSRRLPEHFSCRRLLSWGRFAMVYACGRRGSAVALKCIHKATTRKEDFLLEFRRNYDLGSHPNVVRSSDEAFETAGSYLFAQELALHGDLSRHVRVGGLGEARARRVVVQVSAALEFLHGRRLVHSDVCLENVLAFDEDLALVKLCDLGSAGPHGLLVRGKSVRLAWAPPEALSGLRGRGFRLRPAHDAWQTGVLAFVALTGSYPWFSDDASDRHFGAWVSWLRQQEEEASGLLVPPPPPSRFRCFAPPLLRLLRGLLEPEPGRRRGVSSVARHARDAWLVEGVDPIDIDLEEDCGTPPASKGSTGPFPSGRLRRSSSAVEEVS